MDGITGEEDQERGEGEIPAEVYEAAGRAYCLARYTYSPAAYVSDEARERHIARDALDEARQPSTRAAVNAAVRLIVARYERALREQKRNLEAVHDEAYRAGREDLLRSGSCPECAAGDPHNEPDKPHIHLTTYGYLLYAPDHEQLDFVREIREIERRAGREDAARAGYAEAVARLRDDDRYRNWWTAHPEQQFGTAYWAPDGRQHLADYLETVGPDGPDVRTKPVDQSGVQPTEEQRARDEDQKRDEEREHG
ncbi:MAG: hypothetical protein ACJ786_05350 [Catenulispora sp.]